jgi:hypothetical protein
VENSPTSSELNAEDNAVFQSVTPLKIHQPKNPKGVAAFAMFFATHYDETIKASEE